MHLIIPYAASHAFTGPEVWDGLQLPHLQALLGQLQRQQVWQDPEPTPLHLPHERLHAQALGWACDSAALPWAAWQSGTNDGNPQAWITPCHWQIGMDQVVMADPAALQLSDEESQQLLQAMQPFFEGDGLQVSWHSALLWHARGAMLADLACASLDRVIHQNVKDWMPRGLAARPLQRLQSEMQMLIYNHPVNDAREARRQITVNSFWLHGAGALTAPTTAPTQVLEMPMALCSAALHGDVQAWRQAWQQLDATVLADLLAHFKATGKATLSLCSEHIAHTYTAAPATWQQRISRLFNKTTPAAALAALTL
jgi:hypothetical protein